MPKTGKRPDVFRMLSVGACIIVLFGSGAFLIKEAVWRQGSSVTYENVSNEVWKSETESQREETGSVDDNNSLPEELRQNQNDDETKYNPPPGLKKLMAENGNVKGWIYIEGTQIDYPVMQHPTDNEFYLHRDLSGNKLYSGAIFLDTIHDLDGKGIKLVYGHHMKSSWKHGVMFRELVNYRDTDYMAQHSDIVIWTDEAEYHYKPVYCYAGKADGTYRNRLVLKSELDEFFRSKTGIEPDTDSVLVLVTCSYGQSDERTYVICTPDKVCPAED